MPYHAIINFSFSIPYQPTGGGERDLSQLLQKVMTANIKLRIKILCVPEDANRFRDFLKSERIRASNVKQDRQTFLDAVRTNAHRTGTAGQLGIHPYEECAVGGAGRSERRILGIRDV